MERFIQFNDETVNSAFWMELSDLAAALSQNPDLKVEFGPLAYLQKTPAVLFASHFWHHRSKEEETAGLKTDVYLRALGTIQWTDEAVIRSFMARFKGDFARQLLAAAEDIRLEPMCMGARPGTKRAFHIRRQVLRRYHEVQLSVNQSKGFYMDAVFNALFVLWQADAPFEWPAIHPAVDRAVPFIDRTARELFDARSTKDAARVAGEIAEVLEELELRSMVNKYSHLPDYREPSADEAVVDPGKRQDPLVNDDEADEKENEQFDEQFSTWHRESEETRGTFMQFDLDQGTKTPMMGNTAREGDEGDAALASVQGRSKKSSREQYNRLLAERRDEESKADEAHYGKENIGAKAIYEKPRTASDTEREEYRRMRDETAPVVQTLKRMIQKSIEKKKTSPRTDLLTGRLGRKLTRYFTDENPRLFYKKQEPSREIDAVFYLLIDSSASMYDKMDDVKKSAVLFHETLSSLRVPHEITGFWEDTSPLSKEVKPNYFLTAVPFQASHQKDAGYAIMQLRPEEDNRDGFALRLAIEKMERRSEARKFLIVFSDGEPSAADYDKNGVLDTHEAVMMARKKGMTVFNLFIGEEALDEARRQTMKTIYGHGSIMAPDVSELPHVLTPILKKLLFESI
ncbi:VWA domain-containing protein [Domibacillus sp. PGB-M46]|uniref:vWA domain-containing protein n=1 Tax=Domibacillus sp. PGB-M46 TaxID=2910255 RepID=UPI001F582225|nr:VWA domain-containing protein [Domibacillus sp. PGB-M46]MCI2253948.1 VWA domain-containing protein [Domibacillus sp. PGB-M46]